MQQSAVVQKTVRILAAVVLVAMVVYTGGEAEARQKVVIFHAGSLKVPFAEIEKRFEKKYPAIDVVREFGGSTKMARMITEKNKAADIMASADFAVIDKTLIPEKASWNIRFATNQLVLYYTDRSRFADEVSPDNWYEILQKQDVAWGHSDPNLDPCGYRSLMVLQLAEIYYKKPGLYDRLIQSRPSENVRAKAVELVAMLKNGKMDYVWEYLSVAVQNDLKFVRLSDQINLGNYKFDNFYHQAAAVCPVPGSHSSGLSTSAGQAQNTGRSAPIDF